MEIFQKFKESESIVIDGDKKIGKLTFLLHLLKKKYNKVSLVSPLTANKINKKLESLKHSFTEFDDLGEFIDIFSFREDWILLKNEYGFDYLLQDLEYFISQQSNDVIIFHKIGSIFDYADRDLIDNFFNHVLAYGIKYKKKLVFTLNKDDVNYDLMTYYLIESSDLYMKMTKQGEIREIETLYALSPILDPIYIFENKHKKLYVYPKEKSGLRKNHNVSVIVIAKDKNIQRMHKYLLEKPQIELNIVDSISESLEAILKNPDYLIFSQEEQEANFSVCELSSKHNLYTKTLYLIDKPFLRVDDRLRAMEKGCVDVVNFQIQKMHYVLELAKYLQNPFYKNSIINDTRNLDTKDDVLEFVKYLLEERVLFTLIKIKGKLEELSYIREYDKYVELEDEDYNVIIFINLIKSEVANILFKKIEEYFEVVEIQDCIDVFFGEELCIN